MYELIAHQLLTPRLHPHTRVVPLSWLSPGSHQHPSGTNPFPTLGCGAIQPLSFGSCSLFLAPQHCWMGTASQGSPLPPLFPAPTLPSKLLAWLRLRAGNSTLINVSANPSSAGKASNSFTVPRVQKAPWASPLAPSATRLADAYFNNTHLLAI